MSRDFVPPDFDERAILEGLHAAMGFGTPTRTEDRATFYLPPVNATESDPVDLRGVPFDPDESRSVTPVHKQVACAVEFYDGAAVVEQFGSVRPTKIRLTLLDPEYQEVKGFSFVVAGGDKYIYDKTEPPVALGTIDVWMVWASAENER